MFKKLIAFLLFAFHVSAFIGASVYEFDRMEYLNDVGPVVFGMIVVFGFCWFISALAISFLWLNNDRSDTVTMFYLASVAALHLLPGSELGNIVDIVLFTVVPAIVITEAIIEHRYK